MPTANNSTKYPEAVNAALVDCLANPQTVTTYSTRSGILRPSTTKALSIVQTIKTATAYNRHLVILVLEHVAQAENFPTDFYRHVMPYVELARATLAARGVYSPVDERSTNRNFQTFWIGLNPLGTIKDLYNTGTLSSLLAGVESRLVAKAETKKITDNSIILKHGSGFKLRLNKGKQQDILVINPNTSEELATVVSLNKAARKSLAVAQSEGRLVEVSIVPTESNVLDYIELRKRLTAEYVSKGVCLPKQRILGVDLLAVPSVVDCISLKVNFVMKVKNPIVKQAASIKLATDNRFGGNGRSKEGFATRHVTAKPARVEVSTQLVELNKRETAARRRKSALRKRVLTTGQDWLLHHDPRISSKRRKANVEAITQAAICCNTYTENAICELSLEAYIR